MAQLTKDLNGAQMRALLRGMAMKDEKAVVTVIIPGEKVRKHTTLEWLALGDIKNMVGNQAVIDDEKHTITIYASRGGRR